MVLAAFGAYGAVAGEVIHGVSRAHSDTNFGPPAGAIVVATPTVAVLYFARVFEAVWTPIH